MQRAICEKCGEYQPVDWVAGDLCVACGAAVRREARCAWCTEWIPAGKFCRSCGCEVVNEGLYGAARMLKSAGVDRFSIVTRLHEMNPEQLQNLSRIYEGQFAVVLRRCEEARFCENYLLQKIHSRRIEDMLVPLLPMGKENLDALASGPAGPFEHSPELLPEIALESPIEMTRQIAVLALVRRGGSAPKLFAAANAALKAEDRALAIEAALALGHWRSRILILRDRNVLGGAWLDASRAVEVTRMVSPASPLRPWAAAAFTLARFSGGVLPAIETAAADEVEEWESHRTSLQDGLASADQDLRFTCALALGAEDIIAAELDSADEKKRFAARFFLARHKSPAVGRCLVEGTRKIRNEILDNLYRPLPKELVEPVLQVVEVEDADTRRKAAWLLQPNLTPMTVSRLVKVAAREADKNLFETLLEAESLPESNLVVRTIIEAGLFQVLTGSLSRHIDFSDEAVARFANRNDPQILETLVHLSDKQLYEARSVEGSEKQPAKALATGRFLARIAFGSCPADIRTNAYRKLAYYGSSYGGFRWGDWMGPEPVSILFENPGEFLNAIVRVLKNAELGQMCLDLVDELSEHWLDLGPLFVEHQAAVGELAAALLEKIKTDFLGDRSVIAGLFASMTPLYPAESLPAITALLRDRNMLSMPWRILSRLNDDYSLFSKSLGEEPGALAQTVEALLELLRVDDGSTESVRPTAAKLLEKIATDYPCCRKEIAAEIGPHLSDWTFLWQGREELEQLAQRVGVEIKKSETEPPTPAEDHPDSRPELLSLEQLALLDQEQLLPGTALSTLVDYCRFLQAMGKAANPMDVMAAYGMTVDQYVQLVSAWGELISCRDDVAVRYAQLMAAPITDTTVPG